MQENGATVYSWQECKLVQTLQNNTVVPQGAKNRTAIWPSNSISGYTSKKMKTVIEKNTCTPMFIATLLTIAKVWNNLGVRE